MTTTDLEVPRAAFDELERCVNDGGAHGVTCVRSIAAPVVAAELRRIVNDARENAWEGLLGLERRADELDGPQGQTWGDMDGDR